MSVIEKMERYIRRTKIDPKSRDLYSIRPSEVAALRGAVTIRPYDIICTAFDFGMAKGYRMVKKENKERRFQK